MAERKVLARSVVSVHEIDRLEGARTRPASMREKSSSVFTSLSSRRPLRCAPARGVPVATAPAAARAGERILERPEHQRQRRAELVADVGEEGRLGAVDLGQRFGAAAFLFVGVRVGQPRRELAHEQRDEAPIGVVDDRNGLSAATNSPAGRFCPCWRDRHDERPRRRLVPRARRRFRKPAGELDDDTGRIAQGLPRRATRHRAQPTTISADRRGMRRRDARAADQTCARRRPRRRDTSA